MNDSHHDVIQLRPDGRRPLDVLRERLTTVFPSYSTSISNADTLCLHTDITYPNQNTIDVYLIVSDEGVEITDFGGTIHQLHLHEIVVDGADLSKLLAGTHVEFDGERISCFEPHANAYNEVRALLGLLQGIEILCTRYIRTDKMGPIRHLRPHRQRTTS